ncbi:MAG: response regulator [Bacteroidales bacterium]|nr:response regulator [Bacteroidales bacterium]
MFILLADSNKFYIAVLQTMLSQAGFNCIESACNSVECLFQLNYKNRPDVLIIDESLCDADGVNIIEKVRYTLPHTKIIILIGAESDLNINVLPDNKAIFFMEKSSVNADNLPQVLYNIFTEKISSAKVPQVNKVYLSLRRSFTGMLNF